MSLFITACHIMDTSVCQSLHHSQDFGWNGTHSSDSGYWSAGGMLTYTMCTWIVLLQVLDSKKYSNRFYCLSTRYLKQMSICQCHSSFAKTLVNCCSLSKFGHCSLQQATYWSRKLIFCIYVWALLRCELFRWEPRRTQINCSRCHTACIKELTELMSTGVLVKVPEEECSTPRILISSSPFHGNCIVMSCRNKQFLP